MAEITSLRRQYLETLLEKIEDTNHPSPMIMDRIEHALTDREAAERYLEVLLEKVGVRFPSPDHLERIEMLLNRLE